MISEKDILEIIDPTFHIDLNTGKGDYADFKVIDSYKFIDGKLHFIANSGFQSFVENNHEIIKHDDIKCMRLK